MVPSSVPQARPGVCAALRACPGVCRGILFTEKACGGREGWGGVRGAAAPSGAVARPGWGLPVCAGERLDYGVGVPQVRRVPPLGEPASERGQQLVGRGALALLLPQARQVSAVT